MVIGGGLMIVEGLKGGLLREAWLEGVMGWLWRGGQDGLVSRCEERGEFRVRLSLWEVLDLLLVQLTKTTSLWCVSMIRILRKSSYGSLKDTQRS